MIDMQREDWMLVGLITFFVAFVLIGAGTWA